MYIHASNARGQSRAQKARQLAQGPSPRKVRLSNWIWTRIELNERYNVRDSLTYWP
jgi:hypothetical protein